MESIFCPDASLKLQAWNMEVRLKTTFKKFGGTEAHTEMSFDWQVLPPSTRRVSCSKARQCTF